MNSIFDIVGPVMIGPSSSHTAGAARLAKMARSILADEPVKALLTLYGSFAKTYKGHGTNKALVAGLLGYEADDERIPHALELAVEQGLEVTFQPSNEDVGHPNSVRFFLEGKTGKTTEILGCSTGGGRIQIREISGLPVDITGESYTLMTLHRDKPGVVARVTTVLAHKNINISAMRVFRHENQDLAVMTIDLDSPVDKESLERIEKIQTIERVMSFEPL